VREEGKTKKGQKDPLSIPSIFSLCLSVHHSTHLHHVDVLGQPVQLVGNEVLLLALQGGDVGQQVDLELAQLGLVPRRLHHLVLHILEHGRDVLGGHLVDLQLVLDGCEGEKESDVRGTGGAGRVMSEARVERGV